MKVRNKSLFWIGLVWLIILGISYFIKFPVESGVNYVVNDSLLGILIFHNVYLLISYIVVGLGLLYCGFRK